MKTKGVSPLIAAVILIALVITIAATLSGFLTDFVNTRIFETEEETGTLVDCMDVSLDIRLDSIDTEGDETSFILEYSDHVNLTGLRVATYNGNNVETDVNPEPSQVEPLKPERITANITVDNPERIQVFSKHCPDDEVTVVKEDGDWNYEF